MDKRCTEKVWHQYRHLQCSRKATCGDKCKIHSAEAKAARDAKSIARHEEKIRERNAPLLRAIENQNKIVELELVIKKLEAENAELRKANAKWPI